MKQSTSNLKKPVSIKLKGWMVEAIQTIADQKRITFTDVVEDLLRQELKEEGYTLGIGREGRENRESRRIAETSLNEDKNM
jgi:hypothetical protein